MNDRDRTNQEIPRRVLVVEDDDGLRALIVKSLKKTGFDTEGLANGAEAIAHILADPSRALLLDQKLPDMTGRDLIQKLADSGLKIPFIMMTGQGDEQLAVEMMKLGAADYLVKDLELTDRVPNAFHRLFRALDTERLLGAAREALKQSENRFRTIFENAPYAITINRIEDGALIDANRAFFEILGISQKEDRASLNFQNFSDRIDGFSTDTIQELLTKRRVDNQEITLHLRDGRDRNVICSSVLLDTGAEEQVLSILVDMTDIVQAEAALHDSESRLRSLFAAMQDVILVLDAEGRCLEIAPTSTDLLYQPPDRLLGQCVADNLPADLAEHGMKLIREVIEDGLRRSLDYQLEIEGSSFWFSASISRFTPDSVLWVARDITGRKQAEMALQESEEKFKALAEYSVDVIMRFDQAHRHLYVNPVVEAQAGLKPEEFIGKTHREMGFPDPLIVLWEEAIEQVFRTASSHQIEFQMPNGIWFDWQLAPELSDDGTVTAVITSARDITERKHTEVALRESEKRAGLQRSALARLAVDPALINIDLTAALDHISEVLSSTIGVSRASVWRLAEDESRLECLSLYEAAHQTCTRGEALIPETFPAYFKAIRHESRISAEDAQTDPRTRELLDHYLKPLVIASMLDAGILIEGKMAGVVSCEHTGAKRKWHSDEESFVSTIAAIVAQLYVNAERKRVEEEKEKLQDQLLQAQKMESVGRLAGGVAHDFNNMLGVILGHVELALEQADLPELLHTDLQEIRKAATRSADLTRQLLAFARKQTVSPRLLDLNETLEGMLKMLRRLIGEDIHLAWLPGQELGQIMMDPAQIDQILANLCVNARDAIGEAGKITIETKSAAFDTDYCAQNPGFVPGKYAMLAVSDTGCGMDQTTLAHLFEPFFTTKEVGKGTGLGLATVYGIVRQNEGFINVYSEPGIGTTFRIYLPRQEGVPKQTQTEEKERPPGSEHETILLVEDEPMILEVATTMLKHLGYTVLVASTPNEAMRLAKEHHTTIKLLMTDVVMPGMNGREMAKNILSISPGLKCLFMSGYTADVIAHHGVLDAGVFFIQKPFSIDELAEKVREALDNTRL